MDNVNGESLNLRKVLTGLLLAAVIIVFFIAAIPDSAGFTFQGKACMGMLFAMIALIITEALPFIIVGILLLLGMYGFGVMPLADIWPAFGNSVFFFVIAMFGLYAAMLKTNIPQRIIGFVLRWAGSNSKKIVLGFVASATLLSMVMSNIPTCMLFCGVAIGLLKTMENEGLGSNLGKALFIGIPAASVMGGTAMLSGNAMNVVAVGLVQSATGQEIPFLQWAIVGVPTAIVMIAVISASLCLVFRPDDIPSNVVDQVAQISSYGKMTGQEVRVIIILGTMIALWIASNWVSWLNTTLVALIGLVVMHLPGIGVLGPKDLCRETNWDILMFMGCLMAFMTGFQSSGAADVIVGMVLGGGDAMPYILVLLVITIIPCIAHICIPSGPAVLVLTMVPLLGVGTALGVPSAVVAFIVAAWTGVQFMLPLDGLYMISYSFGYFKTKDILKWGAIPTLALIVLTITLVPFMVGVAGL